MADLQISDQSLRRALGQLDLNKHTESTVFKGVFLLSSLRHLLGARAANMSGWVQIEAGNPVCSMCKATCYNIDTKAYTLGGLLLNNHLVMHLLYMSMCEQAGHKRQTCWGACSCKSETVKKLSANAPNIELVAG